MSLEFGFDDLAPGFLVGEGRYLLKAVVGMGPRSVVWLAQDEQFGEPVALKFLAPEFVLAPGRLEELRREVHRARKLSHPNIVQVNDLHDAPSEPPFFAMEFVDGQNLERIREGYIDKVFTWEWLRPLVAQACAALEYAHSEGLIHRNLHPANFLLDGRGRLKLTGFGLPVSLNEGGTDSELSILSFMSPQQLEGEPASTADDIYSLGAVLYHLLTGTPPFTGGELTHQICNVRPEPLEERLMQRGVMNEVPPQTSGIILKCLAKDPSNRPASAALLAHALESDGGSTAESGTKPELPETHSPAALAANGREGGHNAVEEAEAFERSLRLSHPPVEELANESHAGLNSWATVGTGVILLLGFGYWWGARGQGRVRDGGDAAILATEMASRDEGRSPGPESERSLLSVIQVGKGPAFHYRYEPQKAMALDTNAINNGVKFHSEAHDGANCAFIMTAGTTNNSVGTITYELRSAPGYLIEDLRLEQHASLFTAGRIRGEYSTDRGETFQVFFSTPAYNGNSFGYGRPAGLSSLNSSNVVLRYTLHRYTGHDYNLQFLRDCDDSPAAMEFSGSVIPGPVRR